MQPPIATHTNIFTIFSLVIFLGLSNLSCENNRDKDQAANLLRIITELRMADNDRKKIPLEELRALSCQAQEVCSAKNNCKKAFEHHVRGIELGEKLRKSLDQGAEDSHAEKHAAMLLEMNVEVEEGRKAMPACEQSVADLRKRYRL